MIKHRYSYLLVLASIALIGSTIVQSIWIRNGYDQSRRHMHQQLEDVVASAIHELNTEQEIAFIARVGESDTTEKAVELHEFRFEHLDEVIWTNDDSTVQSHSRVRMSSYPDEIEQNVELDQASGQIRIEIKNGRRDTFIDNSSSVDEEFLLTSVLAMEESERLNEVVRRIQLERLKSDNNWTERLNAEDISAHLAEELAERGIHHGIEFKISNNEGHPYESFTSAGYQPSFTGLEVKQALFPTDLRDKNVYLTAQFDVGATDLLKEIWTLGLLSFLFTITMLLLFILFWRKLLSQSRLSQLKTDFINNMSHELKTPLSTISVAADAIIHPGSQQNQQAIQGYVKTIHTEKNRVLQHIDRVLQMAEAESDHLILHTERIDVVPWLKSIVDSFTNRALEEEKTLVFHGTSESIIVHLDALHMQSTIENLIDNALKYNPKGTTTNVVLESVDNSLVIRIADNGRGIPKAHVRMVFDRFHRVQTGNIHDVKGFGLGLSYVKSVVEAHGGSVKLDSTEDVGTSFELKLPLK